MREREELLREGGFTHKEKIIILAFEGNDTERVYFEDFKETFKDTDSYNNDLIYLHLLSRPKSDTNSAPNHVFRKLKKEAKDEYNFKPTDELWMVIDTDRWKNINEIILECKKQKNMFVAVSNPCFELWLLLHIKDINEYNSDEQKLILNNGKTSKNSRTYVEKKIIEILGTYNKSNPQTEHFLPNIENAIKQAKLLNNPEEEYPKVLGSFVYKIVEKLRKH
jgi:hypothetical protein